MQGASGRADNSGMPVRTRIVGSLAIASVAISASVGGACTPDLLENRLPDTHIRAALGDQPERGFGDGRGHRMAVLDRTDGSLGIQGYKFLDHHTDETLYLSIPHPRKGGRWQLGRPGRGAWAIYAAHEITPDRTTSYGTDETHGGTIVVTRFDPRGGIVEGTFEFEGRRRVMKGTPGVEDSLSPGPPTMRVHSGSFRLKYRAVTPDYSGRSRD